MNETALHEAVADYLDIALPRGAWWRSIANESPAGRAYRQKLYARGVRAGTPDVLIFCGGIPILIELKSEAGKLSKPQEETFLNLTEQGLDVMIARSVMDVQNFLEYCGVPLRARIAA